VPEDLSGALHDDHQPSVAPNTTRQEDMVVAGQRRINLIWEYTQAAISVLVVLANMTVAVYDGIVGLHGEFPVVLSSSLFLIVGFYFSRTNHAAIGGIGLKPESTYEGR
jgi:hypothetical protein